MINWFDRHRYPPPLVALFVAACMWLGSFITPTFELDGTLRWSVAAILVVAGAAIAVEGVRTFAKAKTTINPINIKAASTLVTNGIFTYTRNPMYLGMALALLAWAVFLSSPPLVAGPILFMLFIARFQIKPEEAVLQSKFGQAFTDYRARVRRWV